MTTNGSSNGPLNALLASATSDGILSAGTSAMLSGHLGKVAIAGADGRAAEDIIATDVTLVTILIDASSSIGSSRLEKAVRDGQNALVDALATAKEEDSVLLALWTFNQDMVVVHSFVPVADAVRLDTTNYRPFGSTLLYDTYCEALGANVAYAQRLRDGGTPCRSIVVIVTDGEDVGSQRRAAECARLSQDLLASEQFILAFVGVGGSDFEGIAQAMGIPKTNVLVQKDATPSGLRRAFHMVSQSALRASQGKIVPGAAGGFFAP